MRSVAELPGGSVRFAVLGPLELQCRRAVCLSAAKQRSVLAVLLINAGRWVSLGALVGELWEEPPATAANVVRQYVSRLRKVLKEAGDEVELRTGAAGYQMIAPNAESDVREFEQLVADARADLAVGRPVEAREAVDRALGLWRGPAFADVPAGRSVTAEQVRLDELRTCAAELGAEAGLRAGRVAESIGELKALTIQHPLRERLCASLMMALSASGRTADALAAYRSARAEITSELGLDPSPELRRLEQAILIGEPPGPVTYAV